MTWLSFPGTAPRTRSIFSALSAFSILSVLRIFTGLELLEHGTGKILGFPAAPDWAG
jgi:putative oxidoreductase